MKAWISDTFPDEEGEAQEGKSIIVQGTREELLEIARFMAKVEIALQEEGPFHMHLQDSMPDWSKERHIDIEMTVTNEEG